MVTVYTVLKTAFSQYNLFISIRLPLLHQASPKHPKPLQKLSKTPKFLQKLQFLGPNFLAFFAILRPIMTHIDSPMFSKPPKHPQTTPKTPQNSKNSPKTPIFRAKFLVVFRHFKANYDSHRVQNVF